MITWPRIPASIARPRSTCWWATPTKAREQLGWEPTVDFKELVRLMVDADMEALQATIANLDYAPRHLEAIHR